MVNWTTWKAEDAQALRTEMFEVDPEIFGSPAPLPRRTDGKKYVRPEGGDEGGDAAADSTR